MIKFVCHVIVIFIIKNTDKFCKLTYIITIALKKEFHLRKPLRRNSNFSSLQIRSSSVWFSSCRGKMWVTCRVSRNYYHVDRCTLRFFLLLLLLVVHKFRWAEYKQNLCRFLSARIE